MLARNRFIHTIALSVALLLLVSVAPAPARWPAVKPGPRLIHLQQAALESSDIFKGPPETVTMRSGFVVLQPGQSVGRHSTQGNEEAVIVLAGTGEMRITGGALLRLEPYTVAYCPPLTEHDVFNTGTEPMRYIWLVAKARP